jgi:putative phosphoribosyl transferase
MITRYRNRTEAGRALAMKLLPYQNRTDVVVLALPRGGVPVAFAVAEALGAPLDVWLVRKLGVPGHEELAMGAIAPGGILIINDDIVESLGISQTALQQSIRKEQAELSRRERMYRGERSPRRLKGLTVIVVDDGLATGSTMQAAVSALRQQQPARIVVAVPVASQQACAALRAIVDDVVCVKTPEPLFGVGWWYEDFTQTTDEEVRQLLSMAASLPARRAESEPVAMSSSIPTFRSFTSPDNASLAK